MYEYWKIKKYKKKINETFPDWILIWVFISLIFFLSCCKPIEKTVTKTEYKVEYRDKLQRDSIYMQDSVYIRDKGDTIWIEKFKYIYKDKLIRDTVNITDTVRVESKESFPVITNVIYWYQKYPMYLGYIVILLLAIYIGSKLKKLWL